MAFSPMNVGGSGYKVAVGTATLSTSATTKITLDFEPKYIAICTLRNQNINDVGIMTIYNSDVQASNFFRAGVNTYLQTAALGGSDVNRLASIDADGFTMNEAGDSYKKIYYFAVG